MLMVDLLQWWYVRGWKVFVADFKMRLRDTADTFSIGELFRTLLKPYRQIAADAGATGLNAFFDQLISRLVGVLARLVLILAGVVIILLETIIGVLMMVMWPFMPALPIVGIVLAVMGVAL